MMQGNMREAEQTEFLNTGISDTRVSPNLTSKKKLCSGIIIGIREIPYHKSLLEPFILYLATKDFFSTLRHLTTALSTRPFPVVRIYTAQLVPKVSEFDLKLDSLPLR